MTLTFDRSEYIQLYKTREQLATYDVRIYDYEPNSVRMKRWQRKRRQSAKHFNTQMWAESTVQQTLNRLSKCSYLVFHLLTDFSERLWHWSWNDKLPFHSVVRYSTTPSTST